MFPAPPTSQCFLLPAFPFAVLLLVVLPSPQCHSHVPAAFCCTPPRSPAHTASETSALKPTSLLIFSMAPDKKSGRCCRSSRLDTQIRPINASRRLPGTRCC